jgi:peptidoglycan/LPS O-acetylase OafA/YrhL
MNSNPKTKYLEILQIFRGIAALMVVLHHSIKSIQYYHEINYPFLNYIGSIGKFGVDFFFVLSGFIITYSTSIKYDEPNSFKRYIQNRLLRIYVPYLPICIFMLVIYQLLPAFSNGTRDISILTSLTLIPVGNPALSVAWTLSFELLFYLLFSISFISKKLWNGFVLIWLISVIICTYSPLSSLQFLKIPIFSTLFSPYNLEFILGYCLALCVIRKLKLSLIVGILALIVMMSSFFYCNLNNLNFFKFDLNLLFALGIFIIIYIAIDNYNFKIKSNRI